MAHAPHLADGIGAQDDDDKNKALQEAMVTGGTNHLQRCYAALVSCMVERFLGW